MISQIGNAKNHRESILKPQFSAEYVADLKSVEHSTSAEFGILGVRTFLKFIAIKSQLQNEI